MFFQGVLLYFSAPSGRLISRRANLGAGNFDKAGKVAVSGLIQPRFSWYIAFNLPCFLYCPVADFCARLHDWTMKPLSALLLCLALPLACLAASADLTAYLIDVEGGQSTLFVTPSGQSVLIDTGFPGFNGRDADRIAAVAKTAGVTQIDYLIVTHYHADHVGGVPAGPAIAVKISSILATRSNIRPRGKSCTATTRKRWRKAIRSW